MPAGATSARGCATTCVLADGGTMNNPECHDATGLACGGSRRMSQRAVGGPTFDNMMSLLAGPTTNFIIQIYRACCRAMAGDGAPAVQTHVVALLQPVRGSASASTLVLGYCSHFLNRLFKFAHVVSERCCGWAAAVSVATVLDVATAVGADAALPSRTCLCNGCAASGCDRCRRCTVQK